MIINVDSPWVIGGGLIFCWSAGYGFAVLFIVWRNRKGRRKS